MIMKKKNVLLCPLSINDKTLTRTKLLPPPFPITFFYFFFILFYYTLFKIMFKEKQVAINELVTSNYILPNDMNENLCDMVQKLTV